MTATTTASTVDPTIAAIFGNPPHGLNINQETVVRYDVVVCVIWGIAAAAVCLRMYVRNLKGAHLSYDDYTIVMGLICTALTVFMAIYAGAYGAGKHVWSTTIPRLMTLLKLVYAEPFVYALAVTSTKISILLLYRRLFHTSSAIDSDKIFAIMFWIAVFMTLSYPIILWVTMAAACRPVRYFWEQYIGGKGKCINVTLFYLILGIVNMLNDILILIVPISKIVKLNLNGKKKASIMGIMLLGSFVCVASIVRIYELNGLTHAIDATWWMGPGMAWSSIEPSVAIISACLPTFAPLFRLGQTRKDTSDGYERYDSSGQPRSKSDHMKSGGVGTSRLGFGPRGAARGEGNKTFVGVEEDEIELTSKVTGGLADSSTGTKGSPRSSSERDEYDQKNGIMVTKRIQITH